MAKQFNINDLVWAKMKGYPPWPGKVINPPPKGNSKPKKNFYYIYFFGTENCAWVQADGIQLHSEELIEKYNKRKGEVFLKAVKTIVKLSSDRDATSSDEDPAIQENENSSDEDPAQVQETENSSDEELAEIQESENSGDEDPAPIQESENSGDEELLQIQESGNSGDEVAGSSKEYPLAAEGGFFLPGIVRDRLYCKGIDYTDIQCSATEKSYSYPSGVSIPKPKYLNHYSPPPPEYYYIERPNTPPFDFNKSKHLKKKKIVPTKNLIGFLGFSKIAQGVLKNLSHSGHSVILWDKSPSEWQIFAKKLKIKIADSPTDVVKKASIVFCCFSDEEFTEEILDSILKGIDLSKEKKGYVGMTSLEKSMQQKIATEIRMRGALYLYAGVVESKSRANEGTLYITAGGDKILYDKCKSCFDAISDHHVFTSPDDGKASDLNTIQNMFQGAITVALGEAMALVSEHNLGKDFVDVLKNSDLNYDDLIKNATAMAEQNYEADIRLRDVQKSFTSGLKLGHEVSQNTEVLSMANEVFKRASSRGYGDHDISAVFEATKPI